MAGPYREAEGASVDCPRCGVPLPRGTLTVCSEGCGVWVASEPAHEILESAELAPSRLTTWFRERAPCPYCSQLMALCGYDMSLFQGCEAHGYWIDNETVSQTSLGRAANAALLNRARADAEALKAERARAARALRENDRANMTAADVARRDAAERAEAARILAERRFAEFLPYLDMVRGGDPTKLARKIQELDLLVAELRRRIEDLEARQSVTVTE